MPYEYKPHQNDPLSTGGAIFLGVVTVTALLAFAVWLVRSAP